MRREADTRTEELKSNFRGVRVLLIFQCISKEEVGKGVMIPIVDRLDGIPGSGDPTEDSDHRSLPRRVRSVEQTIHSIKS